MAEQKKRSSMENDGALKIRAVGDLDIVMTRTFDAPRALVFDAWTRPELVKRWLGVRNGWSLATCEIDLRVGGAYRFVWRKATGGAEMVMRGVYREVQRPERFVHTEVFDDPWYPGEAVITTTLVEENGRTLYTSTMRCESREAREIVVRSPMESGIAESFDLLAEVLRSLD